MLNTQAHLDGQSLLSAASPARHALEITPSTLGARARGEGAIPDAADLM